MVHLHISFPGSCEQTYEVESADVNVSTRFALSSLFQSDLLTFLRASVHSDQAEIARLLYSDTCHEVTLPSSFLMPADLQI